MCMLVGYISEVGILTPRSLETHIPAEAVAKEDDI